MHSSPQSGSAGPTGKESPSSESGPTARDFQRPATVELGREELLHEIARLRGELADWQAWRGALVESLPFNLFWKDIHGRFVFANLRFCRTLGRPWTEIYGRTDADFYPAELAEKYRQDDERVMREGAEFCDLEQHKDLQGNARWVEIRKTALRNSRGQVVGVQGLFRDVTDVKEAELALGDAEARYGSLVESLPLAFWRKDGAGRFTFANSRFCEALGQCLEHVLGKMDSDFFPAELAAKYHSDDAHVLETGEVLELVEGFRDAQQQETFVQVFKAPLRNAEGAVIGTQGIFWDVTSRERADRELKLAKRAAEDANRAKSQFLANMSHEIRTPLNGVLGMTELLKGSPLTSQQSEYLMLIESSAEALLSVINDILDFSKVEAGKLELDPQPFRLRDGLDDLLRLLAVKSHAKGLELLATIEPDVPENLVGDANRLRQILLNLLGNAIKFTARGEVQLRVRTVQVTRETARLYFSVHDTGIGIPKDKHQTVFQAFEQADGSTTRRFGGTGLGLAIASRLVNLMGGNLSLESVLGRGSTFFFEADFTRSEESSPEQISRRELAGLPVLVFDDNQSAREQMGDMLARWGMNSTPVETLVDAKARWAESQGTAQAFRLLLLDVGGPSHELEAWLSQLGQAALSFRPSVILLTKSGQDLASASVFGLNVARLAKPIKQSSLFDVIVGVLDQGLPDRSLDEASANGADGTSRQGMSITRPAHSAAASQKQQTAGLAPAAKGLQLLVAEDNPVNQKLAKGLLERAGHHVTLVANGLEAVEAWQSGRFEVVVMDVQMPIMDGSEAVAKIRELEGPTGGRTPILALTAHAMAGDRERCLAAGMDDYVSKPIRPAEFLAAIDRLARLGKAENAANPGPIPEPLAGGLKSASQSRRESASATHASPGPIVHTGENTVEAPINDADVLDWGLALSHTGGDERLLAEIMEVFLDEYPRQLAELEGAFARGDRETSRRVAHALKSGAAHVGAKLASELAESLERAAVSGTMEQAQGKVALLRQALQGARPRIEARLTPPAGG